MTDIGKKIKDLRSAKMMTQQELAGDQITRNMLSRIENGCALPSLPTLLYIAERLGVPAGFLLVDGAEEFQYKKAARMPDILSAFQAGDWDICKDLCMDLGATDDEIDLLIYLCLFNSAREAFNYGDLRSSAEMFEEAKQRSCNTCYPVEKRNAECDAFLYCISCISPSLTSNIEILSSMPFGALSDPFCRYYSVISALDSGTEPAFDITEYCEDSDLVYTGHISAKTKMNSGMYLEAYHTLKGILSSDEKIPAPVLYFIFSDLEVCCRSLSDYKGAYEYSNDKTGMLEKFLG